MRSTLQTSDAGTIGYQCEACSDDEFHLHEDLQYAEIVNDEGKPTTETGDLVVTNLYRYHSPVVRCRTGDMARWMKRDGRCSCGRLARRFRLMGRSGAVLKIGGEKVPTILLENLLQRADALDGTAKIVVARSSKGVDQIILRTSRANDARFVAKARHAFAQCEPLARLVAMARIADFTVEDLDDTDSEHPGFDKFRFLTDRRDADDER